MSERMIGTIDKLIHPQCQRCAHWQRGTLTCAAFPERIPTEILANKLSHTTSYPGDHGIHFAAREDMTDIPDWLKQ